MAQHQEKGTLSEADYNQDARPHNSSDIQSDSDSEVDLAQHGLRTSRDLREHDRSLLREEEERDELLRKKGPLDGIKRIFGQPSAGVDVDGKINRRRERRMKRKSLRLNREKRKDFKSGEERELMFEMEEGFKDTSSLSSGTSSEEFDRQNPAIRVKPRTPHFRRLAILHVLLLALFIILAFGAYKATRLYRNGQYPLKIPHSDLKTNGTHSFRPTTILISLDGFRADFLTRGLTPTLLSLIRTGISPPYMLPSFPSITFPNHFTLVTGLYPESHGIVGNTFWDPSMNEEFSCSFPLRGCTNSKWWTAEPIWVTAEKQKVRTAIHMWPGSEAHIPPLDPTYVDKFNGDEALPKKVDRILSLLDLPGDEDWAFGADHTSFIPQTHDLRPQLIAAYVPNVDADGHLHGPNSTEIASTISQVDTMLADLLSGLHARNLTELVNVVVVSDHGMATTSNDRLVQLDDLIDLSLVSHIDGWPLRGLRLKNEDDVEPMYQILQEAARKSNGAFEVYTHDAMPERYHFTANPRIAPLWVIPKAGWAVVEREEFDISMAKQKGEVYHPKGLHGYDHEHPLMRAIFVARGPAFPHKEGSKMKVFQNTEVYNIVCDSIGVKAHSNNGTLRLPLKPEGIHGGVLGGGKVSDFPPEGTEPETAPFTDGKEATGGGSPFDRPSSDETPESDAGQSEDENDQSKSKGWWDALHDKLDAAKAWVTGILEGLKKDGKISGNGGPESNSGAANAAAREQAKNIGKG
ncbi:MAG: hypothetical protein Q9227_004181 [Pyrenula ochraceoflavens]